MPNLETESADSHLMPKTTTAPENDDDGDKSLDEQKAEALNLFEKEEKKSARKPKAAASESEQGSVYGHLGKDDPVLKINKTKAEDSTEEGESEGDEGSSIEEIDGKKIIHIKPPIIVK